MDETLVQYAQHDIHGDNRCEDQEQFIAKRLLKRQRRSLKAGHDAQGQTNILLRLLNGLDRVAQRNVGGKVKGYGHGRELTEMIDLQRHGLLLDRGDGGKRYLSAACRREIKGAERLQMVLQGRIGLKNDAVLVRLSKNCGNDALA